MIDKICMFLTNKMRQEMPDIDDERAEIINYGLQNIIGEIPKIFIMLGIAYLLGSFKVSTNNICNHFTLSYIFGRFSLKDTHWMHNMYKLNVYRTSSIIKIYYFRWKYKIITIIMLWIFAMAMITLYAPADTENVPILRKSERKQKQILSYITVTIALIVAGIINNPIISNIIIIGYFIQTCTITRIAYKITKNKYGHEVYETTI